MMSVKSPGFTHRPRGGSLRGDVSKKRAGLGRNSDDGGVTRRCGGCGRYCGALLAQPEERALLVRLRGTVRSMGAGDYVCVTLRGGAPWGFTLREGEGEGDIYRPLLASQVEDGSRACLAGVHEGDEVVSINGESCADLTLCRALALLETSVSSLQLLLKRSNFIPSEDCVSEGTHLGERVSSGENLKSTTLHIISPNSKIPTNTEDPHRSNLSDDLGGHELFFKHNSEEVRRCFSPGEFVELQVSLSEQTLDDGGCTSLGSARGIEGDFSAIETAHTPPPHPVSCPNKRAARTARRGDQRRPGGGPCAATRRIRNREGSSECGWPHGH
ncbi:synaptopodin-2 [Fundulus heteroclitus]|uniref:synaptopodin-2 n=1 Tax=Fundulus heteroclitus TaxID=8078 RepID=UPI00165BD451|nr:synaptopodin-2 [Fundulus heteroclitus]